MKLEGTRKSKDGSETTVLVFAMNANEAHVIRVLAAKLMSELPHRLPETAVLRNRLRTIVNGISNGMTEVGISPNVVAEMKSLHGKVPSL